MDESGPASRGRRDRAPIEVVGGLISGSLALLTDAAHMFTDVAAHPRLGGDDADELLGGYRYFAFFASARWARAIAAYSFATPS